ncbi:coenzyme F420 hydrogenase/dehydrogenase beta subunit domain protein [Brachyspira sp. CAG:700]|nr:coenzyme F420 hydrogenase/dehydrogenase beta subunit domain protein [Brachyspira sp. CAG:700]
MTPFYEEIIYRNVLEEVDKKINTIIESLINEKNTLQLKLNEINTKIIDLQYEHYKLRSKIKYNNNWIKLFGIYNTKDYLIFYLFGFKITLKMNEKNINKLAWWIPIRKWRDNFRNKFFDKFMGGSK